MSKLTFEHALRNVLANSRLSRILEGEESSYTWLEAMAADREAVEAIIDRLCEDLSMMTGRKIRRFTKLRSSELMCHGHSMEEMVQSSFDQLNKNINQYLKNVLNSIRADPWPEGLLTYPVNKIYWHKDGVHTILPDAMGKLHNIKLLDPEQVCCDSVEQPKHIRKLLRKCEDTHFDYQPYVLKEENGCKILALRLGCDWHDLAIATWEPRPFLPLEGLLFVMAFFCMMGMGIGLWLSDNIESWWISVPVMIISVLIGIIGGLMTTLLVSLLFKSLKV